MQILRAPIVANMSSRETCRSGKHVDAPDVIGRRSNQKPIAAAYGRSQAHGGAGRHMTPLDSIVHRFIAIFL